MVLKYNDQGIPHNCYRPKMDDFKVTNIAQAETYEFVPGLLTSVTNSPMV